MRASKRGPRSPGGSADCHDERRRMKDSGRRVGWVRQRSREALAPRRHQIDSLVMLQVQSETEVVENLEKSLVGRVGVEPTAR